MSPLCFNLNPVTFNWRKKTYDGPAGLGGAQSGKEVWGSEDDGSGTQYGLIAEEVESVKKDFCSYKKDESNNDVLSGVHYDRLVSPLIKAVQEQKKEIDTLKTKVAALESA